MKVFVLLMACVVLMLSPNSVQGTTAGAALRQTSQCPCLCFARGRPRRRAGRQCRRQVYDGCEVQRCQRNGLNGWQCCDPEVSVSPSPTISETQVPITESPVISETPGPMTETPVISTMEPMTHTPEEITHTPEEMTHTPEEMTHTPEEMTPDVSESPTPPPTISATSSVTPSSPCPCKCVRGPNKRRLRRRCKRIGSPCGIVKCKHGKIQCCLPTAEP